MKYRKGQQFRPFRDSDKEPLRFYVYKITDPESGRFYIGQTRDLDQRLISHKYGHYALRLGNPCRWIVKVLYAFHRKCWEWGYPPAEVSAAEREAIQRATRKHPQLCINRAGRIVA